MAERRPEMRSEPGAVLVSGGAQGIGLAVVRAAARRGAAVAVLDASEEHLRRLGEELGERPHALHAGDATDPDAFEAALDAAERLGPLHGLVNNVGGNPAGEAPLERIEPDAWRRTVELTLTSAFLGSRAALPRLRAAGGGRIVNVASIVASRALPNIAAYSAAKAGVVSLTQTLALEVAADGILVNAVAPGHVLTENARSRFDPAFLARRERAIPTGAHGDPEDVARAVAFLLFEASWLTGAVLPVDGGMSAATLRTL